MEYRLFVDLEAMTVLDSLSVRVRRRLLDHLVRLRSSPESFSSGHERDRIGRRVEINFFAGHTIHYWIDSADRHIKILAIKGGR